MDYTETINILSLCTGYGGLELGISGALEGVLRVVAVGVEAYALANLAAKAQESKLAIEAMWPDLKTFPAQRFRECFDIVLAGYPCQPFSVAGKRQGKDDPRHLWPYIARIIEAVRPVWCFLENVPGHLTMGYPGVYLDLRNMGYKVEAGLFTAAEVGASHKRGRLFILANAERAGEGGGKQGEQGETPKQRRDRPADGGEKLAEHDGDGRGGILRQTGQREDRPQQREDPDGQNAGNGGKRAPCPLADGNGTGRRQQRRAEPVREEHFPPECSRWPSRPGQPQYEWEEPRVIVGDAGGKKRAGVSGNEQQEISPAGKTGEGQAQSRLGGAVDGASRRVDRLRLLGNGVVPQQAEKAFRELMELF